MGSMAAVASRGRWWDLLFVSTLPMLGSVPVRFLRRRRSLHVAALSLLAAGAAAAEEHIDIEGGADKTGHNYAWTVTNNTTLRVTRVEFPHHQATLFFAPDGWHIDCTYLVNVGVPTKPGLCTAWVDAPNDGIPPYRSAEFAMQVATGRSVRGTGDVVVHTSDGREHVVAGVELPGTEPFSDKYVSLIGLGGVLLIAIAVHWVRTRRKAAASDRRGTSSTHVP
jgi:hypothetical protein